MNVVIVIVTIITVHRLLIARRLFWSSRRTGIGPTNVSANVSPIIVLIYMQLWVLMWIRKAGKEECVLMLSVSVLPVSWFILPQEAYLENMQGKKDNGSLLCVLHSPICLMTAGLCDSGFDLDPILQCDLSRLAELRHNFQEIAE